MTEFIITLHNINEKASLLPKLDNFDLKSVKDLTGLKGVLCHTSESEAEKLKALPEVKAVERWSRHMGVCPLDMNQFNHSSEREGRTNYTKDGFSVNNMFAVLEENSTWAVGEGYENGNGGAGVDIIFLDAGGVRDNRPVFGNRVRRIDWRDYAPVGQRNNMYPPSSLTGWGYNSDHGALCACSAAGRGMGLAHKAMVLPMILGETWNSTDGVYLTWDIIKNFHQAKIAANVYRPTIVSVSLGLNGANGPYDFYFDLINPLYDPDNGLPTGTTKIHYQGADYPYSTNHATGTFEYFHNFGVKPMLQNQIMKIFYNDPDTESTLFKDSLDDLMDVPGVIVCHAAGNEASMNVHEGHADYDNYIEWGVNDRGYANKNYYNRCSFPGANDKAIVVGALAAENKPAPATFTNRGPRIDIYAPGLNGKGTMNPLPSSNRGYTDDYREDMSDMAGTSMSCPFFAGALACLLAEKRNSDGLDGPAWINAINPTYVRNIINTVSHDITPSDTADNTNFAVTNADAGNSYKVLDLGSVSSIPFTMTNAVPYERKLGFHPTNTKAVKFYTNGENISEDSGFTQTHELSRSLCFDSYLTKFSEWGEQTTGKGIRNAEMFSDITGDWYGAENQIAYLPNSLNNNTVNKLIFNLNPSTVSRPIGLSTKVLVGWDSSFPATTKIEAGIYADYVDDDNYIELRLTLYRYTNYIDVKFRAYRYVNGNQKYYVVSDNIPNLEYTSSRFIETNFSLNFRGGRNADFTFSMDDGIISRLSPQTFSAPQSFDVNGDPQGKFGLRVSTTTSGGHGPIVIFKDTEFTNTNSNL